MNRRPPSAAPRLRAALMAAVALAGSWRLAADPPAMRPASEDKPVAGQSAEGLMKLGASLAGRGLYSTAEIAYRQIIDHPAYGLDDQKDALLALAHLYRKAGTLTKAVAIYEKFLAEYPDDSRDPDAFLDLGRTLRDMGAYRLAVNRFYSVINTTLKVTPQDFDHYALLAKTAQFEIAQTYYEEGDYEDAGKFFTRVRLLDLAPADMARAYFMAGCAEQRAGELDEAATTLRSYLAQWPADANVPEAQYVLAAALEGLNRPQEALKVTLSLLNAEHRLVATDPRRWAYWQRRTGNELANQFFQNGDILNALAIYRCLAGLSADPQWALPVTYQIALCYERLYQTDQARDAYQSIVDAAKSLPQGSPASPLAAELAGMAAWRIGQLRWEAGANRRLTSLLSPGILPEPPPSAARTDSPSPAS